MAEVNLPDPLKAVVENTWVVVLARSMTLFGVPIAGYLAYALLSAVTTLQMVTADTNTRMTRVETKLDFLSALPYNLNDASRDLAIRDVRINEIARRVVDLELRAQR